MPKLIEHAYLIGRDADGSYRIITRDIRYNDEGIPAVTTTFGKTAFRSAEAARCHARTTHAAQVFFEVERLDS
jgi:hypothetical protein